MRGSCLGSEQPRARPCPGNLDDADVIFPRSVRIGDLDLGGQPDIVVTPATSASAPMFPGTTAPAGSQQLITATCTGGVVVVVVRRTSSTLRQPNRGPRDAALRGQESIPADDVGDRVRGQCLQSRRHRGGPGRPRRSPRLRRCRAEHELSARESRHQSPAGRRVAYLFNGANGNLFTVYASRASSPRHVQRVVQLRPAR